MQRWKLILIVALAVCLPVLQPAGMNALQCAGCCSDESAQSCCQTPTKATCCTDRAACCTLATSSCCQETNLKRPAKCRCDAPGDSLPETPLPHPSSLDSTLELLSGDVPSSWRPAFSSSNLAGVEHERLAHTSKVSRQIMLCVWRT